MSSSNGDTPPESAPLLRVNDLKKYYRTGSSWFSGSGEVVRAVDGVSFELRRGETLGLVGESGCGKSTLALTLLRLLEPTSGGVQFDGEDLLSLDPEALRRKRADMQMIFQDPYNSLNPKLTVQSIVEKPLKAFDVGDRTDRRERVAELLNTVGLSPRFMGRYPQSLSGGQRQRVVIARAIALNPKLVVCDEPVSALDVSIQAQILNLLDDVQEEFGITFIFIAHDLSVVRSISDRVAVMYLGEIVEMAGTQQLFSRPKHPYTEALLSAVPLVNPAKQRSREKRTLEGDIPSPQDPPDGCRFHTRCPYVEPRCRSEPPVLSVPEDGTEPRRVSCHFSGELDLAGIQAPRDS